MIEGTASALHPEAVYVYVYVCDWRFVRGTSKSVRGSETLRARDEGGLLDEGRAYQSS